MAEKVLDANVFVHAVGMDLPFVEAVTVPAVVDELQSRDAAGRYELSRVDVYQPSEESVERVEEAAAEKGEELSPADVRVLALALERGAVLVTDDYGLQNVASALEVDYEEFNQDGIEEELEWKRVCKSCGAEVEGNRCGRCGGEPKRVPRE